MVLNDRWSQIHCLKYTEMTDLGTFRMVSHQRSVSHSGLTSQVSLDVFSMVVNTRPMLFIVESIHVEKSFQCLQCTLSSNVVVPANTILGFWSPGAYVTLCIKTP